MKYMVVKLGYPNVKAQIHIFIISVKNKVVVKFIEKFLDSASPAYSYAALVRYPTAHDLNWS